MKYQPFKKSLLIIIPAVILTAAAGLAIFSEQGNPSARHIPGSITFSGPRPQIGQQGIAVSTGQRKSLAASFNPRDWFENRVEDLMSWDQNPWRRDRRGFGDHYDALRRSKDPKDQARAKELQRQAVEWYHKLLLRYPEMAVTMRSVPAEKNGFLKFLELQDRMKALDPENGVPRVNFPADITAYLKNEAPWNAAAVRAWLNQQKSLVDEIRGIGLLPDRSESGIPEERQGAFISARFPDDCFNILLMQARLAAEDGNAATALESVRAAQGLGDHLGQLEAPTLLTATVSILLQQNLAKSVFEEIIPALPPGSVDPAAWQTALKPTVYGPSDFSRILRGEWRSENVQIMLPILLDTEEPRRVSDGGALLDAHAYFFVENVQKYETATLTDLPTIQLTGPPDLSHLSSGSRQIYDCVFISTEVWNKAPQNFISRSGMTQAAFAILKGQPIPNDPIYGQPYVWDPVTRQLSPPATDAFKAMNIKPIKVPRL